MSQIINELNMVILVTNNMRTPRPAKKQKELKDWRLEEHPKKKARAFVKEVIEILAPA